MKFLEGRSNSLTQAFSGNGGTTARLINDILQLDFRDPNQWAVALSGGIYPADFYAGDLWGSLNSILRVTTGFLFGFGIVAFLWLLMD